MLKHFRSVPCVNKPGADLLEAFVKDLECGWESSAHTLSNTNNYFTTFVIMFGSVMLAVFNAL